MTPALAAFDLRRAVCSLNPQKTTKHCSGNTNTPQDLAARRFDGRCILGQLDARPSTFWSEHRPRNNTAHLERGGPRYQRKAGGSRSVTVPRFPDARPAVKRKCACEECSFSTDGVFDISGGRATY
jgi:hypothetical protein